MVSLDECSGVACGTRVTLINPLARFGHLLLSAHPGNKRFRSLCFSRKAEFEAANPAGKSILVVYINDTFHYIKLKISANTCIPAARKRIAAEIVRTMVSREHTRFLKQTKQGWLRLSTEQGTWVVALYA